MRFTFLALLLLVTSTLHTAHAARDNFGTGPYAFDIEFVDIGYLNNPDDTNDGDHGAAGVQRFGSVSYHYRIGKHEISEAMIAAANSLGGLGISTTTYGANKPAGSIDWHEAARFVNWLNVSTGHQPAYKYDSGGTIHLWQSPDIGFNPSNPTRNSLAKYFLPTDDEWYKSAFYNPTGNNYFLYATGSNDPPISVDSGTNPGTAVYGLRPADITQAGGLSPLGTMAQAGNISEWLETAVPNHPAAEGARYARGNNYRENFFGSSHYRGFAASTDVWEQKGFRVMSVVPEPTSLALLCLGPLCLLRRR